MTSHERDIENHRPAAGRKRRTAYTAIRFEASSHAGTERNGLVHSQLALEDVLEGLLRAVRQAGADDDTEEIINSVWDRLTGWCHPAQRIETLAGIGTGAGADSPVDDTITPARQSDQRAF